MNSDIGLRATTADIGTPKGSSIDLETLRNEVVDKAFGKGLDQSQGGDRQGNQHGRKGDKMKKDSGEGFWRFLAGV
jgi:hypothetical protein